MNLGPPKITETLETDCQGPLTRQCQDAHDRAVAQAQQAQPPVPGEPITEVVKGDDLFGQLRRLLGSD